MENDLLIQKYIHKDLTEKEQLLFDDLYKNDVDFKREVKLHQDLKLAIRNEERISLKKELQDLDINKKVSWLTILAIAASFTLFLIVGSYFLFQDTSLSNQELFAINFEPYRNVMHPVVRGDENLTQIEKAFVYYENGNYTTFISLIKKSNYNNKDYNFYVANAYLANGNLKDAKLILENYIKNKDAKFLIKANWYLGLIYLKLDEIEKAKTAFKQVKKDGGFNLEKVTKLLKQLE